VTVGEKKYVFDAAFETERQRLETMTAFFEPGTHRLLEALGCAEGWRVLEVGGGTGNTTEWLCGQVGPSGAVVATDVDTRFLDQLEHPNLEVRQHNIISDDIEEGAFDLVHARLLLEWLPDREKALRQMVRALKPGGWLLAEDYDFVTFGSWHPAYELGVKFRDALVQLFQSMAGYDVEFGRKLPGLLAAAGLVEVEAEGRCDVAQAGSPGLETVPLTLQQVRGFMEAAGTLTAQEVDQVMRDARTQAALWGLTPLLVAARGRKPS
jgi:SAM-dependent methyltransferase